MLRLSLLFLFLICSLSAQDSKNFAVMIETKIDDTGFAPQIVVSWQNDTLATKYIISRRDFEDGSFQKLAELSGGANTFSDLDVPYQKTVEYEVEKIFTYEKEKISTKSYKAIAWDADLVKREMNKLLILVDYTVVNPIDSIFTQYKQALNKEGWNVIVREVPRVIDFNAKALLSNKELIKAIAKKNPDLTTVLILGRVAVPYSGDYAPDGHGDMHKGAAPTDAFYADLDSHNWTDSSVSDIKSDFPRQHNIVNDGKWDQSFIPGKVELAIGRVDLYDLPVFEESEVNLIINYLKKDIDYRTGKLNADNDAILYDGFVGYKAGFAADGWNNLTALYGRDNVVEKRVREELVKNSYKMVYANAPGAFDNIYDAIYASDIAKTGYKAIHNILFGSFNQDWDSENNLLRSVIASKPMALTTVWGTRPFWTYYKLGLGETFGQVLMSTQNNKIEYSYPSVSYNGGVHISLMGDPTLKIVNKFALKNIEFDYDNDEIISFTVRVSDKQKVYGYQLLLPDSTENYTITNTIFFDEPIEKEFKIKAKEIVNAEKYDLKKAIIRPIVLVENYSGRFYFLGNGIKAE